MLFPKNIWVFFAIFPAAYLHFFLTDFRIHPIRFNFFCLIKDLFIRLSHLILRLQSRGILTGFLLNLQLPGSWSLQAAPTSDQHNSTVLEHRKHVTLANLSVHTIS